jgi:outer membrane lipoprotein-sorting protein
MFARILSITVCAACMLVCKAWAQEPAPTLADMAVSGVRDLEASVTVVSADLDALEKINKDFAIMYRLREVTFLFKEPDKFRMDSRLGVMIVNGPIRDLRVPQLGIRRRDEIGTMLARRHSLMDLGLITVSRLDQLTAKYLRTETLRGVSACVFEITFKEPESVGPSRSAAAASRDRYVVWVDPGRKVILRRRWLAAGGEVRAVFDYLDALEAAPGVWLPRRIEVRNAFGALAGATVYKDIKINQSPDDSRFVIEGSQR